MRLLVEHGADPNAIAARGETPLITAARLGSNAVVRTLFELGADINAKDHTGKTALDLVTQPGPNRHDDTETILRELAASHAGK